MWILESRKNFSMNLVDKITVTLLVFTLYTMIIISLWQKIDAEFLINFLLWRPLTIYDVLHCFWEEGSLCTWNFYSSIGIHTPSRQMEIPKFHFYLLFYFFSLYANGLWIKWHLASPLPTSKQWRVISWVDFCAGACVAYA